MSIREPEQSENLILNFEVASPKKPLPFTRSLQLLLGAVERESEAEIACLYVRDGNRLRLAVRTGKLKRSIDIAQITLNAAASGWLLRLQSPEVLHEAATDWRVSSFPEVLLNGLSCFMVAPLRTRSQITGILTAGWRVDERQATPVTLLERVARAAADLLARARHTQSTAEILSEITQLETELADLKIADRATEVLGHSGGTEEGVSIVHEHVQRVLGGFDAGSALAQQLQVLRRQVEDRHLLNRAKLFLQQTRHMSEEEAYLLLRNTSRRNRRPLREIAQEMLHTGQM